jgi:hypothetical protein
LQQVLITTDNLGDGWIQQPDDNGEAPGNIATGTGCLEEAGAPDDIEPLERATARFTSTLAGLAVTHGAGTYDDPEDLTAAISAAGDALEDCDEITNEVRGATMQATISTDSARSHDEVDQQLTVTALGSISYEEQSQEFSVLISLVRVGRHLTTVHTTGPSDVSESHAAYVEIATARLLAVVAGDEPPATLAPAPE